MRSFSASLKLLSFCFYLRCLHMNRGAGIIDLLVLIVVVQVILLLEFVCSFSRGIRYLIALSETTQAQIFG